MLDDLKMHKLVTVRQKKSIIIVISFLASYGYVYREMQLSNAVQISEKNDFSFLVSLSSTKYFDYSLNLRQFG